MENLDAKKKEALSATSDQVQDAISMFNVARRIIYGHCKWPYTSGNLGPRGNRRQPLLWVALYTECDRCHLRHTQMT